MRKLRITLRMGNTVTHLCEEFHIDDRPSSAEIKHLVDLVLVRLTAAPKPDTDGSGHILFEEI